MTKPMTDERRKGLRRRVMAALQAVDGPMPGYNDLAVRARECLDEIDRLREENRLLMSEHKVVLLRNAELATENEQLRADNAKRSEDWRISNRLRNANKALREENKMTRQELINKHTARDMENKRARELLYQALAEVEMMTATEIRAFLDGGEK